MKQTKEPPIRYEDAAEKVTMTGWACKKCRRFFGGTTDAEHMARWCCGHKDQPCACGGRIYGSYTCCKACRAVTAAGKWLARERREWDGTQMLYSETCDRYFSSPGDFDDWNACRSKDEGDELDRETARLVLCEPVKPRDFYMNEFLCDDLAEDVELYADDIDKIVNDWIAAQGVLSWYPGKYALAK